MIKSTKIKVIVLIVCFFLLNTFWILQDNRFPFIGDDSRWLFETNRLATVLKTGDINAFSETWQNLFMVDTNSVPRTPLFALLSVPSFLLFSANTDVAIITNLIVFAACSWVLYLFCLELFKHDKQKELIGLLAVIAFNVFPGFYGMARLYMSEITQTLIVLLVSYLLLKWGKKRLIWSYLILGILLALGVLLRFIIPIYLVVPALVFIYQQYSLKYSLKEIVLKIGLFFVGFIPVVATWYAKNFTAYWDFTTYTSYGVLAEVTSLGPVWSPITWLKFWKVIGLWHFSWPWIIAILAIVIVGIIILVKKKKLNINLKKLSNTQTTILYLLSIPIPALLMTTLSVNKTARYFLPVEIFIIVLVVYLFWLILKYLVTVIKREHIKYLFVAIVIGGGLISYPFMQSVIKFLPQLPLSVYMPSSGKPLTVDSNAEVYDFVFNELKDVNESYYLIPEQVRLNEAQLQWYAYSQGIKMQSKGELSPQHSLEDAVSKVETATILVIDYNAIVPELYYDKYIQLVDYVISTGEFEIVASKSFSNGAEIVILKRINIYALN